MLLNESLSVRNNQHIDSNEIFNRLIKWGNPKFDQNPLFQDVWIYNVKWKTGEKKQIDQFVFQEMF